MKDHFAGSLSGLSDPASYVSEIAPSDSVDLDRTTRAIAVGTAGTVRVTTTGGTTATVTVAAGVPFPIRCTRIWATGTSATGIVALS